jgi:hypothetical protein
MKQRDKEVWFYCVMFFILSMIVAGIFQLFDNDNKMQLKFEVSVSAKAGETPIITPYRLTSYYTGDYTGSGTYVGSGFNTSQFGINNKGWYTYKGMVVIATATNECLNTKVGNCTKYNYNNNIKYYNYFDTVSIIVDNIEYRAIVLDSCGACMNDIRIDLFVSKEQYAIDRGYQHINEVGVR